jgi:hypothetical protein
MALHARKSAVTAHVKFLKTGAEAKALVAKEQHKTTGKPPPGQVDDLFKLPVWQRTSTTLAAEFVYGTGAAILPKTAEVPPIVKKDLKKILNEIDWHKHGFVTAFLRDVIFWHHRSTSGRFNDKQGRFERWGVKSARNGTITNTRPPSTITNPRGRPARKSLGRRPSTNGCCRGETSSASRTGCSIWA